MQVFYPPAPDTPAESPLRFGILGAANIAPIALILPVRNHPDAEVKAVAARDQGRADAFAKKHGISKAYGGPGAYQSALVTYLIHAGCANYETFEELLDDPEIDVVYNPVCSHVSPF
jgi:predicted dehydrogenase